MENTEDTPETQHAQHEREKKVISTIFNSWSEYRAIETNERLARAKWKTLLVYFKGIKRLIHSEKLDGWILECITVVENNLWDKTPENSVLQALFELWFQLKWLTFDLEEKLVLLDGLELLIPDSKQDSWLKIIIDELREYAKECITTDLRLQSTLDDHGRKRP